nr:type I-E CRISPR-associated protein Cas6/Cse3/CasE [uncultured Holophaga sp.]
MYLHRLHLDLRNREARRDLADSYQLHATLSRAFSPPEIPCPAGAFLWRLEPETGEGGSPRLLVQGGELPDWSRLPSGWLVGSPDPAIHLASRMKLDQCHEGQRFRFRLRANPSACRGGKRIGLLQEREQRDWLARKGVQHGFSLMAGGHGGFYATEPDPSVLLSQAEMLRGRQLSGNRIKVFSVLFDGYLVVSDPGLFREALARGIGHGKALGLGLLSVAPLP